MAARSPSGKSRKVDNEEPQPKRKKHNGQHRRLKPRKVDNEKCVAEKARRSKKADNQQPQLKRRNVDNAEPQQKNEDEEPQAGN